MTNTNLVTNLILKDIDIFETIEDDAASKVVGGQSECTEENRTRIISGLQASGLISSEQVTQLQNADLTKFCTDIDDYLEASTGVKALQTATTTTTTGT